LHNVADFNNCGQLWNAVWTHKEGNHSEHKAIERGEIRGTLSGTIADDELLLEQQ
jgi:hypothetical protein